MIGASAGGVARPRVPLPHAVLQLLSGAGEVRGAIVLMDELCE